ncbi:MAG TPA: sugar phosphate isomerase/epimerase [Steroidobacter sp.]|uniref:sugar phosphate isomerase/epimerase family protein n=1 Tax=Steroidobacter sp. TaxID=1978227 RepID=UPI002EDA70C9
MARRPASRAFGFSLAHLTLLDQAPPELTEIAARAGYDYVSLRAIPLGLPNEITYALGKDRALFRRTKAALASTGVRLLDIELARIYSGVDVRSYLPAIEAAAELGGAHLLCSVWCDGRSFVLDRFIELCELTRPFGITVDLEFVTFASINTLSAAIDIVSASRCDNAGICIDTLHFDRSHCTPEQLASVPPEWFHYAQICDGPANYATDEASLKSIAREGRLYLGEGNIDVPGILANMPSMPYSIELPNRDRQLRLGPEEFARQCLVTARCALYPPDPPEN